MRATGAWRQPDYPLRWRPDLADLTRPGPDRRPGPQPDRRPYRREPQLGLRSRSGNDSGLTWSAQGEFNRFTHPDPTKPVGNRLQAVGRSPRPLIWAG